MSDSRSLTLVEDTEYEAIEAAMTESARGRRFLAEYARRNRSADTDVLLQAIGRLESAVTTDRGSEDVGRLRGDLVEMADAIARTKAEISALSAPDQDHSRLTVASEALDAIVRATERATSDILGAAEEVQEAAWTLRESGTESAICDELDRHATQIYTACSFQDLTAQRTGRIVHTLRYLEDRIASMIGIWGSRLDAVPPHPGYAAAPVADLCQSDVDLFLANDARPSQIATARAPLAAVDLHDDLAFLPDATEPEAPSVSPIPTTEPERLEPMDQADATDAMEIAAIERLEDDLAFDVAEVGSETAEEPPAKDPTELADDLALAFDDLDALSIEEKIALFS